MDQQMKDEAKKNKNGFSDPNSVVGFTRGLGDVQDPRDAMQEAFLKKEEKGNSTGDMPDVSLSRRTLQLVVKQNTCPSFSGCWSNNLKGERGILLSS
jgi:hypothetical protein